MYVVSGKTFEYRELIKSIGGKWDGNSKTWLVPQSADLSELRKIPLINIQHHGSDEPKNENERAFRAVIDDNRALPVPVMDGAIRTFGDDMSYRGIFMNEPTDFFGFSSLSVMCDFVEDINRYQAFSDQAWIIDEARTEFTGTQRMREALELARNGWPQGVDKAAQIVDMLDSEQAHKYGYKYAIAGNSVNVGRMLAGNPLHMKKRDRKPGKQIITLYALASMSRDIDPNAMIVRAAAIAATADILEDAGFACEIIAVWDAFRTFDDYHGCAQLTCKLKDAGEPLALNDVVFALGHPSFLRRMCFACASITQHLARFTKGMGFPRQMLHEDNRHFMFRKLRDTPSLDPFYILTQILPKHLPIRIVKNED